VKGTPTAAQHKFLEAKGLNETEIKAAFAHMKNSGGDDGGLDRGWNPPGTSNDNDGADSGNDVNTLPRTTVIPSRIPLSLPKGHMGWAPTPTWHADDAESPMKPWEEWRLGGKDDMPSVWKAARKTQPPPSQRILEKRKERREATLEARAPDWLKKEKYAAHGVEENQVMSQVESVEPLVLDESVPVVTEMQDSCKQDEGEGTLADRNVEQEGVDESQQKEGVDPLPGPSTALIWSTRLALVVGGAAWLLKVRSRL